MKSRSKSPNKFKIESTHLMALAFLLVAVVLAFVFLSQGQVNPTCTPPCGPGFHCVGTFCMPDAPPAIPGIDSCVVISSSGNYQLNASFSGATNPIWGGNACILIQAPNVNLNCLSHTISNDNSSNTYGIAVDNVNNVTIRNCRVSSYYSGVRVNGSNNGAILNSFVFNNGGLGIYLYNSNNSEVDGNYVHDNSNNGVYVDKSYSLDFTDNRIDGNDYKGAVIGYANNLNISSNNLTNNTGDQLVLTTINDSVVSGNRVNGSDVGGEGIVIAYSNNVNSSNNVVFGHDTNGNGIFLQSDILISSSNEHLFNNTRDLLISGNAGTISLRNIIIDRPAGDFLNFTNLSLSDTLNSENYYFAWNSQPAVLNGSAISFRGRFVQIANFTSNVNIDNVTWAWRDDELPGYSESNFELWKYTSVWTKTPATLYAASNSLTLLNLNPASTYAVVQVPITCPIINTSGTFTQASNYAGAPNSVAAVSTVNWTCVYIRASDVIYDCNGYNITGSGILNSSGILVGDGVSTFSNVTVKNCPGLTGYPYGMFTKNLTNGNITNNSAYSNTGYGIYLSTSSNNLLTHNTAYQNSQSGINIAIGSNSNTLINNTAYSNTYHGIVLPVNSNNTLINNTAYSNPQYGIYLSSSSNNNLTGNNAFNNGVTGIYLSSSSNNTLTENSAYNNSNDGFYLNSNFNTLTGNSAYNSPNAGFELSTCSNNTLTGNTAHDITFAGILLDHANNINLTGNELYNNNDGMQIFTSDNNLLTSNIFHNNNVYGLDVVSGSDSNVITGNVVRNNPNGVSISDSNQNALNNNAIYSNTVHGISISQGSMTTMTRDHFYNNANDMFVLSANVSLNNVIFDMAGDLKNFTNLSISETTTTATQFAIDWNDGSIGVPSSNFRSFLGKYVNITPVPGWIPTIDSATWSWTDSESANYTESMFELWKYNASGWTNTGAALNTGANSFTLTNMNPASTYAILERQGCPLINTNGTYLQDMNYTGAPNSASPLTGNACVEINASNVVYDCNGYKITHNSTPSNTYGILVGPSLTNVTVRNCPGISSYAYGILAYNSTSVVIDNVTAFNNTADGISFSRTNYSNITNSRSFNNTYNGFGVFYSPYHYLANNIANTSLNGFNLGISCNDSYVLNNTAYNNRNSGFLVNGCQDSNYTKNTAYGNTLNGFMLSVSSRGVYNNNTAYSNLGNGFNITSSSSSNTFANNTAYLNPYSGFLLIGSGSNTLSDNTAYNNSRGFRLEASSASNTLRNNRAYNALYGFYLYSGSNFNTLIGNSAYYLSDSGFAIDSSSNNNLSGNLAWNATNYGFASFFSSGNSISGSNASNCSSGFFLSSSNNTNLINNSAYNNTDGLYLQSSSSYNTLTNNNAYNNTNSGIYSYFSNSNTYQGNNASGGTYGIYIYFSNSSNFTNNNVFNTTYGLELVSANWNILNGNRAYNNSNKGLFVTWATVNGSNYNLITNNTAYGNGDNLYVSGHYNNITNNTFYGYGSGNGINLAGASIGGTGNLITDNNISNLSIGIYVGYNDTAARLMNNRIHDASTAVMIANSYQTSIISDHYYNNAHGIKVFFDSGPSGSFNLSNVIFDRAAGNYQNFTNLSIYDNVASNTTYYIDWYATPLPMPDILHTSFAGKTVNITPTSGSPVIDNITWTWRDDELSGYNESMLELWRNNGTWSRVPATLNIGTNSLTNLSLNQFSTFSLLNASQNCPIVNASFTMPNQFIGAPNSVSALVGISSACVVINASNIVFDCNGYSITNNATINASGIFAYLKTNITIKNCPGISNYTDGIVLANINASNVLNTTLHHNNDGVFITSDSFNNNLSGNIANNNTIRGFYAGYNVYNTRFTDNIARFNQNGFVLAGNTSTAINNLAYNNTADGFTLYIASLNSLTNNSAYDNGRDGFMLNSNSKNNTLANNSAYRNAANGFEASVQSNSNSFVNNTASNNRQTGMRIDGSQFCILQNNIASFNNISGVLLIQSPNNIVIGNTAHNTTNDGFHILNSNNTNLTSNIAFNNTNNGITMWTSSGGRLVNNTVYKNLQMGFYIYSSANSNVLENNLGYNNTQGSFWLNQVSGNNLTNNTALGNGYNGFVLANSNNSRLIRNNASGATQFGFLLYSGSASNLLANNTVRYNVRGIKLDNASGNNITNNAVSNCNADAITLASSANNILSGNSVGSCSVGAYLSGASSNNLITNNNFSNLYQYGIQLASAGSGNNISSNILSGNALYGIYALSSGNIILRDNLIFSNTMAGVKLVNSTTSIYNDRYYNNAPDLSAEGAGQMLNLSSVLFINPSGNIGPNLSYVNLSLNDALGNSGYTMDWRDNSTVLPLPYETISFEQKFLDIAPISGSPSIDSITWNWLDSESAVLPYTEGRFELVRNNGTWNYVPSVVNYTANTLTNLSLNQFSVFAILQDMHEKPKEQPKPGMPIDVSVLPSCDGFIVKVQSDGSPLADAFVKVFDKTHSTELLPRYSDSDGEAIYQICGIDVEIQADKNGS